MDKKNLHRHEGKGKQIEAGKRKTSTEGLQVHTHPQLKS